jgi:inosose dehydratase
MRSEEHPGVASRLAGAPISWGVCEVPGWGRQLGPDRVLGEMSALGLGATELGAAGWLPTGPGALRELLAHLARLEELVAGHGLTLAVHPHAGTLLEAAAGVERLLDASDVNVCFDSGHLLIGGFEPAAFAREHADRIAHVHLKDIEAAVAERLRAGELGQMEAVQAGLFRPLGDGDAAIVEVVRQLQEGGYGRWLVLEQDTAITGQEPPVGSGPVLDVRKSIEFLDTVAPTQEEVI